MVTSSVTADPGSVDFGVVWVTNVGENTVTVSNAVPAASTVLAVATRNRFWELTAISTAGTCICAWTRTAPSPLAFHAKRRILPLVRPIRVLAPFANTASPSRLTEYSVFVVGVPSSLRISSTMFPARLPSVYSTRVAMDCGTTGRTSS